MLRQADGPAKTFGPPVVSPPAPEASILGGGVRDACASWLLAGWIRFDVEGWGAQRLQQCGPWVEALAVLDLRYWADPRACEGRKRPSERRLADAWGWKKTRVHRLLEKQWADPYHVAASFDLVPAMMVVGLAANHQWTSYGPAADHLMQGEASEPGDVGPRADQERTKSGPDPKGDTGAFTSPSPPPVSDSFHSVPSEANNPSPGERLVEVESVDAPGAAISEQPPKGAAGFVRLLAFWGVNSQPRLARDVAWWFELVAEFPTVDHDEELVSCRDYYDAKGKAVKNWKNTIRNWFKNAIKFGRAQEPSQPASHGEYRGREPDPQAAVDAEAAWLERCRLRGVDAYTGKPLRESQAAK